MNCLWILAACAALALVNAKSFNVVGNLNERYGMSALFEKAAVVHRAKRQSGVVGPRSPDRCAMECFDTMSEKLTDMFPDEVQNATEGTSVSDSVLKRDFDPAKFEKFCKIYTPSSRCLKQCPSSTLKDFTVKSMAMVEFMCVDRYADFQKYGACMDKAGKEIDEVCTPQCSQYEQGSVQSLENVTSEEVSQEVIEFDLSSLLNHSCSYVGCLSDCDQPIMTKKCGQQAADLEHQVIGMAFKSLEGIMTDLPLDGASWPESCAKLSAKSGKEETDGKLSRPEKPVNDKEQ